MYSWSKFEVVGAFERRIIRLIKPIYFLGLLTVDKDRMKLRNKFSFEYRDGVSQFLDLAKITSIITNEQGVYARDAWTQIGTH